MDSPTPISFTSIRRFGVEFETNSFDKRDFQKQPLSSGELPHGIDNISSWINDKLFLPAIVHGWHSTHNNNTWVLKPDRSCGIELCSPVTKGWDGLKQICKVADLLKEQSVPVDDRCSLHVHAEVNDCSQEQLGKILAYWIKCESVFLDSVPFHRKRNRYCQCIGMTDLFEHDSVFNDSSIVRKLGSNKYYTANCFHLVRGDRKTIEFRIAESAGCTDSFLVKNWVRLLIHFIEVSRVSPVPKPYRSDDSMSGFCWLDLEDVFTFLQFSGENLLSRGMEQTRNWFLSRIYHNVFTENNVSTGVWSDIARKISKKQVMNINDKLGFTDSDMKEFLHPGNVDLIYSNEYV